MNLDTLYHKIKNPSELLAEDLSSLKELSVKYPFSQLFSILYLKALAQSKDLHFEDEIQHHAFKVTDRAKLHELIYSNEGQVYTQDPEVESEISEIEHPSEIKTEAQEIQTPEIAENLVPEQAEIKEEIQATELVTEQEEPKKEVQEEIVYEIGGEEKTEDEKESKEFLELEKEFLSHVIASSYSIEFEGSKKTEEAQKEEKINLSESRSFSSWLKVSNPQAEPLTEKEKIIEKFIQEEPERIKPKKDFYSAPKKAKESVSDEKLLYTETLANIFALQGNYPKAITAFQHLMLTNPEKKLYFAQKIEELNKKINS